MDYQITCPKCTKRFSVAQDITGKTVECGQCDHRFKVTEEDITSIRERVYPGQHRGDDFLNRIGKAQLGQAPAQKAVAAPKVEAIMPSSFGQKMALGLGLSTLILFILIFFFGTEKDGMFEGVPLIKRYILGAFITLIFGGLTIFGAKNWAIKATFLVLLLSGGIFALITLREVHFAPEIGTADLPQNQSTEPTSAPVLDSAQIQTKVGYFGMERKIDELIAQNGDIVNAQKLVTGLFIESLATTEFHEIEDHLRDSLDLPVTVGISRYKRQGDRDSLIVISDHPINFERFARLAADLGTITTYPELRLISLEKSPDLFTKPSVANAKFMNDPNHVSFPTLNLQELSVLNRNRVETAITRLATYPAGNELRYEGEITTELLRHLDTKHDSIVDQDLGQALIIWGKGNSTAIEKVTAKVKNRLNNDTPISASWIDYLIQNKVEIAPVYLDQLWAKEPEKWASLYTTVDSSAQNRLLFHLETAPMNLKTSAVRILHKIGTSKALSGLAVAAKSPDSELKILAQRAIEAIKARS